MTTDLRQLAEAATPGPWQPQRASTRHVITAGSIVVATAAPQILGDERKHNAAYIAACSPDRILALLDVVDAAQALVAACDVVNTSGRGYVIGSEATACTDADDAFRKSLAALGSHQGKGE